MTAPRCPDCKVAMKEGWIPDAAFGGSLETYWQEGLSKKPKVLGKMPIQAFRCSECGLVRIYAFPRKWNELK
jgi:hypothetical protein